MAVRIGVLSPHTVPLPDVNEAFGRLWPEAVITHLVDDSLYLEWGGKTAELPPVLKHRVAHLLAYCASTGPDAILVTGSVFCRIVEEVRGDIKVPVVTATEGLVQAAFRAGKKLGIVTTSPFSLADLKRDLERYAQKHGLEYTVEGLVDAEARRVILEDKDRDRHDAMVAATVARLPDVDAILLGQFSLTTAYMKMLGQAQVPVLAASATSIARLKEVTGART